jgi:hypothetical protein
MEVKVPHTKLATTTWRPLVDVTTYDRDPELSQDEYNVLDAIMHRPGKRTGGWGKQAHRVLQRLLRPLYDVYDISGTNRNTRRRSVSRLLVEMHQRRTAFWGWDHDEWLETVCPNYAQFYRRHKECAVSRQYIAAVSYLLCDFNDVQFFGQFHPSYLAPKVFGQEAVNAAMSIVHETLLGWGFTPYFRNQRTNELCLALINNHSPRLEDLTFERLAALRDGQMPEYLKGHLSTLSRVLVSLGIMEKPLPPRGAGDQQGGQRAGALKGVPSEWAEWYQHWRRTSTHAPKTRQTAYYNLLLAGRWAARMHPEVMTPEQ